MEQPNGHPKVSVIIPVYNTCNYVQEALESICRQTLTDLEIIVIDDGSTDGSREVIDKIAATDIRIRVYGQTNQGQSITRNNGMLYATGKYIYFMDSDDRLEVDALETGYSLCESRQLDFTCFDASILNKEHPYAKCFNYERNHCIDPTLTYKGTELLQLQLSHHAFSPSPCLNLIRAKFLKESGLNFYPKIIHEDQLFTSQLYLKAQKVGYIPRKFFLRRFRSSSTMTQQFTWKNIEGYLTVTNELMKAALDYSENTRKVISRFLRQMLDAAVWQAHTLPLRQRLKLCLLCLRHYKRYVSTRTLMVLILKKQKL
ncbi:glycosyltransferase [Bacteroides fragilis]|uniref:glycosyltransferase family 2 protein n=1 Tax=Bacteroides fragilis TaxID=817 RepID=UPI000C79048C|nr:glycosyltransferase [Bacteroides fragilis]AUI46343.1 glycosyl transferase family A [Bacteroides fragilis]MCE8557292.1 glycosyltransferase [Bacteroides fragilis]